MLRRKVTVRVPATSANLGPGYDCVGMAVDLWNEVTVEAAASFSMQVVGEGADTLPRDDTNYIVRGVALAFAQVGAEVPPLAYFCKNQIPVGSGLGSSSAGIISGLLAGLVLVGKELPVHGEEQLLQLAAEVEGHIDNLSPCIYGGLQLGLHNGARWETVPLKFPNNVQCIVFTPDTPMDTALARAMLPTKVTVPDATFNMARLALLVHALAADRLDMLRAATEDRLHQPVRGSDAVMPALFPVIQAALDAGAKAAFLSGAGSSIMALTSGIRGDTLIQSHRERNDRAVADAMVRAAGRVGVHGRIFVTRPATMGAHVVFASEPFSGTGLSMLDTGVEYRSTRDVRNQTVTFEKAVMDGLAPDGGLYVPTTIPKVTADMLRAWRHLSYPDLALQVMSLFISRREIPESVLHAMIDRSYATFDSQHVVPLLSFQRDGSRFYLLEQFHGPTCAFKDVALQFVGNLFEYFLERRNAGNGPDEEETITVLGATSGDTGSAAIEGLRGKKNVEVFILHPKGRVAPVQAAQMTTILDENIHNVAVEGMFDDCQTIVKALFNDAEFREKHTLAAINSINWARILAQIVYYFYAYFRFLDAESDGSTPSPGDSLPPLHFVVPTGNFGNALACFYAEQMGLPVGKLTVATNSNDILHRFFADGDYSARPAVPTLAPAMDIVIPSNFERYLFHAVGGDASRLVALMKQIKGSGTLSFGDHHDEVLAKMRALFSSSCSSDAEIQDTCDRFARDHAYHLCPHTACGVAASEKVPLAGSAFVCLATAHPAKFGDALARYDADPAMAPALPPQLANLLDKQTRCYETEGSVDCVRNLMENILEPRRAAKKAVRRSMREAAASQPKPAPQPQAQAQHQPPAPAPASAHVKAAGAAVLPGPWVDRLLFAGLAVSAFAAGVLVAHRLR